MTSSTTVTESVETMLSDVRITQATEWSNLECCTTGIADDDDWLPPPSRRIRRDANHLEPIVAPLAKKVQKKPILKVPPKEGSPAIISAIVSAINIERSRKSSEDSTSLPSSSTSSSSLSSSNRIGQKAASELKRQMKNISLNISSSSNTIDNDDDWLPATKRNKRSSPSGLPMHPLSLPVSKKKASLSSAKNAASSQIHRLPATIVPFRPIPPIVKIGPDNMSRILFYCDWRNEDAVVDLTYFGDPDGDNHHPHPASGLNVGVLLLMTGDSLMPSLLMNLRTHNLALTINIAKPTKSPFSNNCPPKFSPFASWDVLEVLKPSNVRINFHRAFSDVMSNFNCASMQRLISSLPNTTRSLEYLVDRAGLGMSRLIHMVAFSNVAERLERLVIGCDIMSGQNLDFKSSNLSRKFPCLHTLIIDSILEMSGFVDNLPISRYAPTWTSQDSKHVINATEIPRSVHKLRLSPRYIIKESDDKDDGQLCFALKLKNEMRDVENILFPAELPQIAL